MHQMTVVVLLSSKPTENEIDELHSFIEVCFAARAYVTEIDVCDGADNQDALEAEAFFREAAGSVEGVGGVT